MIPGGGGTPIYNLYRMCRCEEYGFQAVWSGIGYTNQGAMVQNRVSMKGKHVSGVTNLDQNRV